MERNTSALTGLRGVAAVWVMAGHFSGGFDGMPAAHLFSKAYLAVDLFFLLSGFVIALNHGAAFAAGEPSDLCGAFYRRRIARIYPLLLVVMVLTLVRRAVVGAAPPTPVEILANLSMTHAWFAQDGIVGPSWSVSVEAFAYLAFPWIAAFAFRRSLASSLGAMLVAWSCLWWMTTLDPAKSFGELDAGGPLDIRNGTIYPILRCVCEFVTGVCVYRLTSAPRVRAVLSTRGLPEILIAAVVVLAWRTELDLAVAAVFTLLIGALTIPGHAASRALRSPLAMRLGDLSYAIYLTHMLVGTIVRDLLVGTMPYGFVLVACALASLAVAAILHVVVERPCQAMFRSRRRAPPPVLATATT